MKKRGKPWNYFVASEERERGFVGSGMEVVLYQLPSGRRLVNDLDLD